MLLTPLTVCHVIVMFEVSLAAVVRSIPFSFFFTTYAPRYDRINSVLNAFASISVAVGHISGFNLIFLQ